MNREIINRMNILNPNISCLVIGKSNEKLNDFFINSFKNNEFLEFTNSSILIMNQVLFNRFDIVIVILDRDDFNLFEKSDIFLPENSIYIIHNDVYGKFERMINKINFLGIMPINIEKLAEKILKVAMINFSEKLLEKKEIKVKKIDPKFLTTEFTLFLEQYSGEVMFLNDDFNEHLTKLKNLEVSKELFSNISLSLNKLAVVIKEREELKELSEIFFDLSNFIVNLNLKDIDITCYEKFDYFTLIIEDITIYIDELFVRRLFNNVRVFSDSLSNNIKYFKEQLHSKNSTLNSSLEFFDD